MGICVSAPTKNVERPYAYKGDITKNNKIVFTVISFLKDSVKLRCQLLCKRAYHYWIYYQEEWEYRAKCDF